MPATEHAIKLDDVRLVHTADWHLGHTLAGHSRELEHQRFLEGLVDVVDEAAADALVVCGDVYDQGNPPATALSICA